MSKARNPELSKDLHRLVWDLWVYKNMGTSQIANYINSNVDLRSKFGEISKDGIYYHVVNIRNELENTVNEDALDSYVGEFIRAKEGLDNDVESIQKLIDSEENSQNPNKDILIKLMRLKHEIKVDKFKLLQDVELPIRVKKLKRERQRLASNLPIIENAITVVTEDGVSEQRNTEDNSISDN